MKKPRHQELRLRLRTAKPSGGMRKIVLQDASLDLVAMTFLDAICSIDGEEIDFCFRHENEGKLAIGLDILHAIWKRLRAIDSKGNRRPGRQVARELILDIIVARRHLPSALPRYEKVIAGFAARNDIDFFVQLGRGFERGRNPVFKPWDWFCLWNWHEWNNASEESLLDAPGLKYWTHEAIADVMSFEFRDHNDFKLRNGKAVSMRLDRLGLRSEKKKKVLRVFPRSRDNPGRLRIEAAEITK